MVTTHPFTDFARRLAATIGCPDVVVAETPNPIRQLDDSSLRERAEAMLETVIYGLTQPPQAIQRRRQEGASGQIRPRGVVRAAQPV